jgi:hypothetical protein
MRPPTFHGSGKPVLVREWMAHHQGMSLLAILNLLHDNVVQRWFHANPEVQGDRTAASRNARQQIRSQGETQGIVLFNALLIKVEPQ